MRNLTKYLAVFISVAMTVISGWVGVTSWVISDKVDKYGYYNVVNISFWVMVTSIVVGIVAIWTLRVKKEQDDKDEDRK